MMVQTRPLWGALFAGVVRKPGDHKGRPYSNPRSTTGWRRFDAGLPKHFPTRSPPLCSRRLSGLIGGGR
jgi:hypothetical protein